MIKNDEEVKQELRERGYANIDEVLAALDRGMEDAKVGRVKRVARYVEEEHQS